MPPAHVIAWGAFLLVAPPAAAGACQRDWEEPSGEAPTAAGSGPGSGGQHAAGVAGRQSENACANDVDDDGDGKGDCFDEDCASTAGCQPGGAVEEADETCSDGVDNDGDSYTDCADFSCSRNDQVNVCENTDPRCSDGLDNELFSAVKGWIGKEWPFEKVAYPGRDIDWETWQQIDP